MSIFEDRAGKSSRITKSPQASSCHVKSSKSPEGLLFSDFLSIYLSICHGEIVASEKDVRARGGAADDGVLPRLADSGAAEGGSRLQAAEDLKKQVGRQRQPHVYVHNSSWFWR